MVGTCKHSNVQISRDLECKNVDEAWKEHTLACDHTALYRDECTLHVAGRCGRIEGRDTW